jgi:phenylacetate-CoA ligase
MDLSYIKKHILLRLPLSLWPNNKDYSNTKSLIQEIETWNKEKISQWQFKQLKELIDYTWEYSLGYKQYWSDHGFYPENLVTLDDIQKIPFITKKIIQNDIDLFSINSNKSRYKVSTGGSTGVPFSFYNSKKLRAIEDSFINSIWSQFFPNISRKTVRTTLRGGQIEGNINYDPLFGLRLSSRDVTPDMVEKFIVAIDKYKTPIFHVYPSSLYIVAKIMQSHGIKRSKHKFKVICFGSEPLYQFQIETIKTVFDEPRCFWYGSTEKVVLASNCEHSDAFHIYPQYGITEIIKADSNTALKGEIGEIVGTSFWGRDTPFIRYKTGDMARVGADKCLDCGCEYQLLDRIEGRIQEFVVGKNKRLLSMTYINAHDDIFETIQQFRFKQEHIGIVEFLYVRKENLNPNVEDIINRLSLSFGSHYEIIAKEVDTISLTKAGKMSFLEQSLDISKYL